jgi:hypothetical protein
MQSLPSTPPPDAQHPQSSSTRPGPPPPWPSRCPVAISEVLLRPVHPPPPGPHHRRCHLHATVSTLMHARPPDRPPNLLVRRPPSWPTRRPPDCHLLWPTWPPNRGPRKHPQQASSSLTLDSRQRQGPQCPSLQFCLKFSVRLSMFLLEYYLVFIIGSAGPPPACERKTQPIETKASGAVALGFLPRRRLPHRGLLPLHIVPFVTQYCIYFRGNPSPLTWYQRLSFFSTVLTLGVAAPLLAATLPGHRLPSGHRRPRPSPPFGHRPPQAPPSRVAASQVAASLLDAPFRCNTPCYEILNHLH